MQESIEPMIESDFPNTIILDTTNLCNARCPFCPLFQGDAQFDRRVRPAAVMSLDLYDRLISQIADWPTRPAALVHSANGEILQDPKLHERLRILKERGLASITSLLTNAQYLSEAHANAILDSGVSQLIIGFDGATKETYEAHRVRCDYDRVLGNIRRFVAIRASRNLSSTKILLKFVRTQRNEHELIDAFKMFSTILDPELDRFQDALAVDWSDNPSEKEDLYFRPRVKDGVRRKSCEYFDNALEIQPSGTIAACCWDYNLTVSDGGLGEAAEEPLIDIWRGKKRHDLQIAHLPGGSGLPEKCQSCIIMNEPEPITDDMIRIDPAYLESKAETALLYRMMPMNA
ncbi:radical SAM/SPASM domain-containing protein [Methylobacterium sp. PvR107]|uniref:radical SAM protein n=1 Tax=Methylobacterium sp. PvR107 TaxID=2806597 RepID=UPI001AE8C9FD|nr:radical SAM/SPASM domain-containing protein [Methylobacterium sp. PvR107]MBP1178471.1 MoaA/NifB/PqqE/SkfB family radical SAM enzyme [Methylobacterium sp. PvR107]